MAKHVNHKGKGVGPKGPMNKKESKLPPWMKKGKEKK